MNSLSHKISSSATSSAYYDDKSFLGMHREVKPIHLELSRYTVLWREEKSVKKNFSFPYIGKISVNPSYKKIWVLKGNPASCFLRAKPPGSNAFFLVKRSLPGGSGKLALLEVCSFVMNMEQMEPNLSAP